MPVYDALYAMAVSNMFCVVMRAGAAIAAIGFALGSTGTIWCLYRDIRPKALLMSSQVFMMHCCILSVPVVAITGVVFQI